MIKLLKNFGNVEWYRHAGGLNDDGTSRPPLVVWRFSEPRPMDFKDKLHGIVEADDREIDWLFDTSRRNWVLVPSRVMEEKNRHGFAVEAQAVSLLEREDPEFCQRSVSDFERILRALDQLAGTLK
ncbi:hypothetical protein NLM24_28925 [Nocardia zapadnayensis]|uniref:hypothetical protein n=1 Tax=Nocardia rhamnosiphila TaxID=426716 RepID=UPI0022479118|nr:hypothetical protein [Nocardia zapadnayensis]MCX0274642.1 hypothetical protein [Nocardia zapadnayensis]